MSLNPQQQQAVNHNLGPLVVFAGAGSGKTRVITHRISKALSEGVPPYRILAMTFTNKAAREMKERLHSLTPLGRQVHISTFHGTCARWLREFGEHLGYSSQFSIYSQKESKEALKKALEEFRAQHPALFQGADIKPYMEALSDLKTMGLMPQDAQALTAEQQKLFGLPPLTASIYIRYQEILAASNAMDFADLQLNVLLLLKTRPDLRERIQRRHQHILVDEYQDTNTTQSQLIHHLYHDDCQLCVVGDDDQAIYSWRGANPEHILAFQEHWANAHEIRLEQNYRCSKNIVDAASALIQHNKVRADKILWTDNPAGEEIGIYTHHDSNAEAWEVIQQIEHEAQDISYDHTVILYRTKSQSRALEEALRHRMIPYQIHGALAFYERVEIKDLLCWIRAIVNPRDEVAFKRIINVPARKIGPKGISLITEHAENTNTSFFQATQELANTDLKLWNKRFSNFIDIYTSLQKTLEHSPLRDTIDILIAHLGYTDYLGKKFDDFEERISNVHELSSAFHEYSNQHPSHSLDQWLQDLALQDSPEENEGGVNLMTLHAAKGLEFQRVYIVGTEDGLLPHSSCMDDPEQLEEERRLLYVGMTRAAQKLSLHRAEYRRQGRDIQCNPPSQFLTEIPQTNTSQCHDTTSTHDTNGVQIGQRVEHPSFGLGTITQVRMEHQKQLCIVAFDFVGLRKVHSQQLRNFGKPDTL
ncbi:MAG: ATP-dependent helicase [Oligoflexales bacterium]